VPIPELSASAQATGFGGREATEAARASPRRWFAAADAEPPTVRPGQMPDRRDGHRCVGAYQLAPGREEGELPEVVKKTRQVSPSKACKAPEQSPVPETAQPERPPTSLPEAAAQPTISEVLQTQAEKDRIAEEERNAHIAAAEREAAREQENKRIFAHVDRVALLSKVVKADWDAHKTWLEAVREGSADLVPDDIWEVWVRAGLDLASWPKAMSHGEAECLADHQALFPGHPPTNEEVKNVLEAYRRDLVVDTASVETLMAQAA
jgi:hypothetical protein